MSDENEVTPRPWTEDGAQSDYAIRGPGPIVDGWCTGPIVLEIDTRDVNHLSRANCDFILKAVNNYDELVAVLEAALLDHDRPEEYGCRKSTLARMEAALAKAKK